MSVGATRVTLNALDISQLANRATKQQQQRAAAANAAASKRPPRLTTDDDGDGAAVALDESAAIPTVLSMSGGEQFLLGSARDSLAGGETPTAATASPAPRTLSRAASRVRLATTGADDGDDGDGDDDEAGDRAPAVGRPITALIDRRGSSASLVAGTQRSGVPSPSGRGDLERTASSSSSTVRRPSSASSTLARAKSGSQLASSRWRVFGVAQRPTPEWRRKPGLQPGTPNSTSNVQQTPPETPDGHHGSVGSSSFPVGDASPSAADDLSAAAADDNPLSVGAAALASSEIPLAASGPSSPASPAGLPLRHRRSESSTAGTPSSRQQKQQQQQHNPTSFKLGRSYAESVIQRRNATMKSGDAWRLSRAAAKEAEANAKSAADHDSGISAPPVTQSPSVAGLVSMTQLELERLLQQRGAQHELAVIEKYERELIAMSEQEASAIVEARIARHERDAARAVSRKKETRIMELEKTLETLAQRFLFKPSPGAPSGREPIPQALPNGRVPHPSQREEAAPLDFESAADRQLYTRLKDVIASFERKSATAASSAT